MVAYSFEGKGADKFPTTVFIKVPFKSYSSDLYYQVIHPALQPNYSYAYNPHLFKSSYLTYPVLEASLGKQGFPTTIFS
jgi:hypothetical protein